MGNKPYRGGFNYIQRRAANTEADFGDGKGKKKKPYRVGNHVDKEHYHHENFGPLERRKLPEIKTPCQSKSYNFDMPLSIDCTDGEQDIPIVLNSDFESPVISSDAGNGVSLGDRAIEGFISLEGASAITFDPEAYTGTSSILCITICDEVCGGCSIGCLFLRGCDVDPCDGEPQIEGSDTIGFSTTSQYTIVDPQGDGTWGLSGGGGASIDQEGLVTTDGYACGTITITYEDDCGIGTKNVRLGSDSTSYWRTISSEGAVGCPPFGPDEPGVAVVTGYTTRLSEWSYEVIVGAIKYRNTFRCVKVTSTCSSEPSIGPGMSADCSAYGEDYMVRVELLVISDWACR